MDAGVVLGFWAVAVVLVVVPGADWAFVLDAGARGRSGAAVVGLATGYLGLTVVVALGVGALVARSATVLTVLTVVGAAYLLWQGVRAVARPPTARPDGVAAGVGGGATLGRGVGVSGLNPKALLLFLAVLPQFADPAAPWPLAAQLAVLGVVFVLTVVAFYLGLGTLSSAVLAHRPRAALVASRAAGVGMVVVAVALLVEGWMLRG